MELSIFDVLGPVMVGPSSSHTAGAARLARVAAIIADKPFHKVTFGLSGSFAKTGTGHGTDKALVAGALKLREDDSHLRDAYVLAKQSGLQWEFYEDDLEDMHENSVHITFYHDDETTTNVWGSSIGGGRIRITRIGQIEMEISGERPTLVVKHLDRPGVVSDVTKVLSVAGLNIGLMRLSRQARGAQAVVTLELDQSVPTDVVQLLRELPNVLEVVSVELS